MPRPRKQQVALDATPYYHVISRCVRQHFLCGRDRTTGRDFSHRRGWIVARIKLLAEVFALDICAYAVMSNHYHLVLKIDPDQAEAWSPQEVVRRWCRLFSGPPLARHFLQGATLDPGQHHQMSVWIDTWRARLTDLSWFMRCLNEPIARQANLEDQCTGRFWEGRFKSQALLDEAAVISAMAYVDLNPIRAGLADTPEGSDFTSIQGRVRQWAASQATTELPDTALPALLGFDGQAGNRAPLPMQFEDYLELVDWSGRVVIAGKTGAIAAHQPEILARLGINGEHYRRYIRRQETTFHVALGSLDRIRATAQAFGRKFFKGQGLAARLFIRPA